MPQSLRERISQAIAKVDESLLGRTWEELEYRVEVCRVNNEAHIEHLWKNFMNFHIALKLFNVFICKRLEITIISYQPNHL
jgi:hypothetical protein